MQNPIKRTVGGLIKQTNDAIAGLIAYGAPLNITTVLAAVLTAARDAFIASNSTCNAARTELSTRQETLRGLMSTTLIFLGLTRDVLRPHLGRKHNAAWVEAGFKQSLRIPRNIDEVLPLLTSLVTHLTAHPEQENLELNVIAARASTLLADVTAARNAVNAQKTILAQAMTDREEKGGTLRGMLRVLIAELAHRMNPLDERYRTFGLNRPGQLAMPDVPTGVVAILVGPNAIAIKWNKSARAEYYRVWKRVVGVDEELVPVGSPADLDFALEGLPQNATVEIAISALNNGGESQKTEVVTVVTSA